VRRCRQSSGLKEALETKGREAIIARKTG
jgi:hypothetical protein